jgi:hypothetical protein
MFVSIRRYFVHKAPADELAELVDRDFADRISGQPGFVSYEFLDGGEGEAMSISAFRDAAQAENSRALARRWVEEALSDLELTTLDSVHGEIRLTHATAARPPSVHPDAPAGFAAVRRARLAGGSVAEVVAARRDVWCLTRARRAVVCNPRQAVIATLTGSTRGRCDGGVRTRTVRRLHQGRLAAGGQSGRREEA